MAEVWLRRVDHMLEAIADIEEYLQDDLGTAKTRHALERAFEVLSEASRHIPADVKARFDVRWQALADLGNIIRHAYDRVSVARLVETAEVDLPPLRAVLLAMKSGTS